jgi:hypothetical protein
MGIKGCTAGKALWLPSGLTLKSLKDIGCSNDYKNKGRILINSNQIVE